MATRTPAGLVEYRTHYRWAVVAITGLFLALLSRFFLLQIVRGGEYRQDQLSSQQRSERIPAQRGLILDRNGVVLATDVETHDLVMRPLRVRNPERTIELLRRLLHLNDEDDAHLRELVSIGLEQKERYAEIVIRRDLVSHHSPVASVKLEVLDPPKKTLWCSQCGRNFDQVDESARTCPRNRRHKLRWNEHRTGAVCKNHGIEFTAGTACPHDGAVLRQRSYTLRCPETGTYYNNEKAVIDAHLYEMVGFEIRSSRRRVYPYRNVLAHVTGYMNQVNRKDLDRHGDTYAPGDRIGRSGTERALEKELRGTWGRRNYRLDRRYKGGPVLELPDPKRPDVPVIDGTTVRLTIDVELQRIVQKAMRYHRSGAAVVLDVHTGEILAMYSRPSFDPNLWSGRLTAAAYRAAKANPYSPMLNKALTAYAPGSVYKLVTAVAAVDLGKADLIREIQCKGYYEFGGRRFRCHNRFGHGPQDLIHAMSRSCDIYFYRVGEEMGMEQLYEYATRDFGFGRETGIEIAESVGVVPNKDWHRRQDRVWMPGFTLSTAVGQKDVRSTPLQVTRAFAGFANGGELKTTHILKQLEDRKGNVVRVVRPRVVTRYPMTAETAAGLGDSFWRVVNDEHGTAFGARMDGIEVSGKTGTAEAAEHKAGVSEDVAIWLKDDHAWFTGYAPSRKPEIAVTVFLDHGHSGGKAAAPVAMKIFKGYFSRRTSAFPLDPPREDEALPNPITAEPPQPAPGAVNKAPIDL